MKPLRSHLSLLFLSISLATGCGASQSDVVKVSLSAARVLCRLIPPETSSSGSELFSAPRPDRAHVEVHRDGAVELVVENDASAQ